MKTTTSGSERVLCTRASGTGGSLIWRVCWVARLAEPGAVEAVFEDDRKCTGWMVRLGLGPLLARRARPPSAFKAERSASRWSARSKVDFGRNTGAAVGGRCEAGGRQVERQSETAWWCSQRRRDTAGWVGGGRWARECACDGSHVRSYLSNTRAGGQVLADVDAGAEHRQRGSQTGAGWRLQRGLQSAGAAGWRTTLGPACNERASASALGCLIRAGRFRFPLAGTVSAGGAGLDAGGAIARVLSRLHRERAAAALWVVGGGGWCCWVVLGSWGAWSRARHASRARLGGVGAGIPGEDRRWAQ